jgi:hypothetical protein
MLLLATLSALIATGSYAFGTTTPVIAVLRAISPQIADAAESVAPPMPVYLPNMQPFSADAAALIFDAQPGPDTPTIGELALGAADDAGIMARIVAYYEENRERLAQLWREEHPTRLAGLFSMYIVHISHIYGETRFPASMTEFVALERTHCGVSSMAQSQITEALGLNWRTIELTSGWHAWVEIEVDGVWEIFDSTVNVWIDQPAEALLQGVPRAYRNFYTPLLDRDRPDARLHMREGYNMQNLRLWMPGLGLFYNPPGELFLSTSAAA